jgi:hypothetical protein
MNQRYTGRTWRSQRQRTCSVMTTRRIQLRRFQKMRQVYFLPLYNVAILMSTEHELSWDMNLLPAI